MSMTNYIQKYFLLEVEDYHEFDFAQSIFRQAGIDISFEEIGCKNKYSAVFWTGTKTKKVQDYIDIEKQKLE